MSTRCWPRQGRSESTPVARAPRTPPIPPAVRAVIDRLETRGPVRAKPMFGGHGVWCADRFVAIVFRGVLYLKVDATTRPLFEAAGGMPFQTDRPRPSRMGFYTLPDGAAAAADDLDIWLDRAVAAASRPAAGAGSSSITSGR